MTKSELYKQLQPIVADVTELNYKRKFDLLELRHIAELGVSSLQLYLTHHSNSGSEHIQLVAQAIDNINQLILDAENPRTWNKARSEQYFYNMKENVISNIKAIMIFVQ